MQEQQLVKACQEGEMARFGELYDLYVKKIYNFIYYKTYHKETAEDLTSRTFIKAYEAVNRLEAGQYFSAWIYRIARNTVIDHYRSQKTEKNIEEVWDIQDNTDISLDIEAKEQLKELKEHLNKLSKSQREIVIMRVWDDMSYKEIAEIMETTEENCRVNFSRGVKKLRQSMPLALFVAFISNII